MAQVKEKADSASKTAKRWLALYDRQQKLIDEQQRVTSEMRSLRGTIYSELRTWALSDEAILRELKNKY